MRKRVFPVLLAIILCLSGFAHAQGASFVASPQTLRPGKAERIGFSLPHDDTVSLLLLDDSGVITCAIRSGMTAAAGVTNLAWNGCDTQGQPLAPGRYTLHLVHSGGICEESLDIGPAAPQITFVTADAANVGSGGEAVITAECNMPGTLYITLQGGDILHQVYAGPAQAGSNRVVWDGMADGMPVPNGDYILMLLLTGEDGFNGNARQIGLSITNAPQSTPSPGPTATPAPTPEPTAAPVLRPSGLADTTIPGDYWSMEVENLDWKAIWDVMTSPMTVIEVPGKDQKETYKLRKAPDDSSNKSNIVGEITLVSQGVNVLETREDGWSYIEAYNSSYGPDCPSRRGYGATDELIYGYVRTSYLTTFTPKSEYGLLIDKLDQVMYILKDGELFTTVTISTGVPTKAQPWNETPAGEYYLCSKVGGFPAGNLTCAMGMRINGGCILHEVPYILNEKYNIKDYSSTEPLLGAKASHGCVRVQRKKNADGVNMQWIWNNVPLNTKVLIWDDTGRKVDYPAADDLPIYYNPDGGKYYHADQNCKDIKDRYLPLKGVLTYGELDNAQYQKLTPCKGCIPPMRKSEIDKINAQNGF